MTASAFQIRTAAMAMAQIYTPLPVNDRVEAFYPYAKVAIEALHVSTKGADKWMPIEISPSMAKRRKNDKRLLCVDRVPWLLLAGDAAERQAKLNHGKSLQELAAGLGIDACEAVCLISGIPWDTCLLPEEQAHRILDAMITMFARGKLFAEGALA